MYIRWTEKYTGIVHEEFIWRHDALEKRYNELKNNYLVASVELSNHSLYKH